MKANKTYIPKLRTKVSGSRQYAVVYLNGRMHYFGPWGADLAIARYHTFVAEWIASGRSTAFGVSEHPMTIADLNREYLAHCGVYYGLGRNAELHRIARAARTLESLYASLPPAEFGIRQFKALQVTFMQENLSRSLINAHMKRIVRMFKWLAGEGRISPIVPQALAIVPGLKRGRTAARETDRVLPVADEVVEATLPYLTDVVANMVRFHRRTGCRPAEVCLIRPCDVDRSGDVWVYKPPKHKTDYLGKERLVHIGPHAQDALRRYLLRPDESYCFSPKESEQQRRATVHDERTTPMSCGNRPGTNRKMRRDIIRAFGDHYDPRSYRRAIWYGCKNAGIEPWAPNRLRHTAATEIRKRCGLEAAQVVLGHSQANITQIYAERDATLAIQVAKLIG